MCFGEYVQYLYRQSPGPPIITLQIVYPVDVFLEWKSDISVGGL